MNSLGGRQATVSVLRRGGAFGPALSHRLDLGANYQKWYSVPIQV